MSLDAMKYVWDNSAQFGDYLLTMLALADYADERGSCYPSVSTLAQKTRQSDRNIQRVLKYLETQHELVVIAGAGFETPRGATNRYYLVMPGVNCKDYDDLCAKLGVSPIEKQDAKKKRGSTQSPEEKPSQKVGVSVPSPLTVPSPVGVSVPSPKPSLESLKEREALPLQTWQTAFERYIRPAVPNDLDFFRDIEKRYSTEDITYAIIEASKNDPAIKYHAHRGIEQALEALERSRETSIAAELKLAIKGLIFGSGNETNIKKAASVLTDLDKVNLFLDFWKHANPIGKPDQRPHASQVLSYMPDALEWHAKRKPLALPALEYDPNCLHRCTQGYFYRTVDDGFGLPQTVIERECECRKTRGAKVEKHAA